MSTTPDTTTGTALVHPATGEVIDLKAATTTELADVVQAADEFAGRLRDFRGDVIAELATRMDKLNKRTVDLDAGDHTYRLETNAPSEDEWPLDELRQALRDLVEADVIDADLIRSIITYGKPKPPAPSVAKRELNKLLANPKAAERLNPVKRVKPKTRTVKITVEQNGRG